MIYTEETFEGEGDREKLLPELERSADDQVIWLGLGVVVVLALIFFGISRLGGADEGLTEVLGSTEESSELTVGELLAEDPDLDYTGQLFDKADINRDLGRSGQGPYTVFVPTDSAWEDLAEASDLDIQDDLIDELNSEEAGEGAGSHIVEGEYTLSDLVDEGTVTTIDGYILTFADDELINGSVEIVDADIEASNGLLHKINSVLPTG